MLFPLPPEADRLWLERDLLGRGVRRVCGVDEVGRGPLAGPVVAAAVILPLRSPLASAPEWDGLNDSKQLSPAQREEQAALIMARAEAVAIAEVSAGEIDETDILTATLSAMRRAVENLAVLPDFVLVDGSFRIPGLKIPQRSVVRGDGRSASIAAASIVAKVHRDHLMAEYHRVYPHYGFLSNKGYGTREHLEAIGRHGCCELHRKSFRGVLRGKKSEATLPPARQVYGAGCEERACELLAARGYEIVCRNWRGRRGEIDIIAKDGEAYVFVEVRARSKAGSFGGAAASITAAKQERLSLTALEYLQAAGLGEADARFDVVLFPGRERPPEILRGAFDLYRLY
ncbi:MAG: ribonuclease HII [Pseudomonadota bacterium]